MQKEGGDKAAAGPPKNCTRAEVEALIRGAFSDVKRGNGLTLHQARALDDHASDKEVARAADKDRETHWSQVHATKIDELHDVLPFLNEEGFRFYIAAYMLHSLAGTSPRVAEGTEMNLRSGLEGLQQRGFTPAQYRAVVAFLRYMVRAGGKDPDEDWELHEMEEWVNTL